jgi:hypothetical protein
VATDQLGDEEGCATGVDAEVAVDGGGSDPGEASSETVGAGRCERVGDPSAGVVDEDVDGAEGLLRGVEDPRRRVVVTEVGLEGERAPGQRLDPREDLLGTGCAPGAVALRGAGVGGHVEAEVRDQHVDAACGEGHRGRRADAVVGTGDDRDVAR